MNKKLLATRIVNFICLILVATLMFGTWLELSPARRHLSAPAYIEVEQKLHPYGAFMFPTMLIAIASTAAIVFMLRNKRNAQFYLTALALIGITMAFIVTVKVHLPINQETDKWSITNPPADWAQKRQRWENWHTVRAWAAVIALSSSIGAILLSVPREKTANKGSDT